MSFPQPFGKYLLLESVNAGGMGEIFRAKTFGVEGFEKIVAVKRILPNLVNDKVFAGMFIEEARLAARLTHPNIVQIYELGKVDGEHYIAMEYISGKNLRQILRRARTAHQPLPEPLIAFIGCQICEALAYAHSRADSGGRPWNVVHRDINPQNVLVSFEGDVKIADFGIAKSDTRAWRTGPGVLKGKLEYMSPEQASHGTVDHRADIFGIGLVLYEMAVGERALGGKNDIERLERARNATIEPPRRKNPLVSKAMERIILRTLARDANSRYADAARLQNDLARLCADAAGVFTARRLAAWMHERYQADIIDENDRVAAFMRARPLEPVPTAARERIKAIPVVADPNEFGKLRTSVLLSNFGPRGVSPAPSAGGGAATAPDLAMPAWLHAGAPPPRLKEVAAPSVTIVVPAAVPRVSITQNVGAEQWFWRRLGLAVLTVAAAASLIGLTGLVVLRRSAPPTAGAFTVVNPIEIPTVVSADRDSARPPVEPTVSVPAPPEPAASAPAPPEPAASAPAPPEPAASVPAPPEPAASVPAPPEPVASAPASPELIVPVPAGRTVERVPTPHRAVVTPRPKAARGHPPPPSPRPAATVPDKTGRAHSVVSKCAGSDGLLSLIALGAENCSVSVDGTAVGSAPLHRLSVPTGSCVLEVVCADGRRFKGTRLLRSGEPLEVVIREGDWKKP
jgi:eukaryotic-like serine/threonine-protein kinase